MLQLAVCLATFYAPFVYAGSYNPLGNFVFYLIGGSLALGCIIGYFVLRKSSSASFVNVLKYSVLFLLIILGLLSGLSSLMHLF